MLRTKGRKKRRVDNKPRYRVNERIRIPKIRVIDEDGKQLGIMDTREALKIAQEKELDLIEVFPKSDPPVCKILDYGQFQYQQSRKNQAQKSNIKKVEIKGIRISFKIGKHDLDLRKNQAVKFLNKGYKVKIEMILRGRERKYAKDAAGKVSEFINTIRAESEINIETEPKKQGNQISAIIAPSASKQSEQAKQPNQAVESEN